MKKPLVRKFKEGEIPEGVLVGRTTLLARHIRDGKEITRRFVQDRVVTAAFVNDIVDVLTGTTGDHDTFVNYKFHDSGVGTSATEAAANTALEEACGDSRDAGTQVESTATNIYKSVATHTYGSTHSITEHGLFNASSGGTLMDRTVFTAIDVDNGDKIEFTFTITFSSGG